MCKIVSDYIFSVKKSHKNITICYSILHDMCYNNENYLNSFCGCESFIFYKIHQIYVYILYHGAVLDLLRADEYKF